jgi:hypothetical protein
MSTGERLRNHRMTIKKMMITLLVVLALGGGILYALPYGRVFQIISALQGEDRDRLARYIDFSQLRDGMKEQIRSAMSSPGRPAQPHDLERVRQAMLAKVMDDAVDQVITPEGLASFFIKNQPGLIAGADKPPDGQASAKAFSTVKIFMTVLYHAHFAYSSSSEFVVAFRDEQEKAIRFLFRRAGLDWRLIGIEGSLPVGGKIK